MASLTEFLIYTHALTTGSLVGCFGLAYILSLAVSTEWLLLTCLSLGAVMLLVGAVGVAVIRPMKMADGESWNTDVRKGLYATMVLGASLLMCPVIVYMREEGLEGLVLLALVMATALYGTLMWFAYSRQQEVADYWLSWKSGLEGIYLGWAVTHIAVGLLTIVMGRDYIPEQYVWFELYGGLVLLSALCICKALYCAREFAKGNPDHLGCSVMFFLYFFNLFLRILEILQRKSKKDDED